MFLYLVQYQGTRLLRLFSSRSPGQLITALLFVGLFLVLATGLCWLLIAGLSSVQDDEFLRSALPYFVYELFLLVLCGLVGASALISGTFALFRQTGDQWFMVSPQYRSLLISKALLVGVFSLWPLLVVALPLLIAMVVVYEIGLIGLLLGVGTVVSLGLLTTMSALVWLLGLGYVAVALAQWHQRTTAFGWFLLGVVLTILGATVLAWWPLRELDLYALFAVRDFTITEAPVAYIAAVFQSYPSHVAATALYALQMGSVTAASVSLMILAGAAAGVGLVYVLLGQGFLRLWQALQEARFVATTELNDARIPPRSTQLVRASTAFSALVRKELQVLLRTPRDLFWLGFLLLLWLVVTSFDVFLVENVATAPLATVTAVEWIQALQFLVIVYFAAALTLRFAFPAMSTERDHVWALLSVPVSHARLFAAKAVVHVGGVVGLTLLVTSLHLWILPTSVASAATFLGFGLLASTTIGLLGLGIGARYPNFSSDDPQQLSTSVPGLAFMALAITYGTASAYALFQFFATAAVMYLGAFAAISLGLCWLVYTRVVRQLPRVEFVGVTHS